MLKPKGTLTHAEQGVLDLIVERGQLLAATIGTLNPGVYRKLTGREPPADIGSGYGKDPAEVTLALRHLEDALYRAEKALTGQ
jgi:hypothetical protein